MPLVKLYGISGHAIFVSTDKIEAIHPPQEDYGESLVPRGVPVSEIVMAYERLMVRGTPEDVHTAIVQQTVTPRSQPWPGNPPNRT